MPVPPASRRPRHRRACASGPKRLGGELRVERPREGGTVVELRVPLARAAPADRARVLLVEDHAAVREAIAPAFAQDDEFIVAGEAGSLAEARGMLDEVDVAIVDLGLPDGDGSDLIEDLHERDPRIQTLVLSAHATGRRRARRPEGRGGACSAKATHLPECLRGPARPGRRDPDAARRGRRAAALRRPAARARARRAPADREPHPREREVLQLLADGLDSATIARRLHISPRTQRNHVANILGKLGVHSQLQAVVFALRHGVVEVPREPEEVWTGGVGRGLGRRP